MKKKYLITSASAILGTLLASYIFKKVNTGYDLKGKTALVTGGARGLGFILAKKLASKGSEVLICSENQEDLNRAVALFEKENLVIKAIYCDLMSKEQIDQLIMQVKSEYSSLDILINNAGTIKVGPVQTMNQADFQQAMNLHFWAPFHLMAEFMPMMGKSVKSSRIVNIVSIGGKVSFPHLLPYNVSKYALSGLSEGLSAEFTRKNIKITTVYPGLMTTGSPPNVRVKGQARKEYGWFKISDSLPLISIDAEKAAGKIINAMQKGKKTLVLSLVAKLAIAIHGLFPGLNIGMFSVANWLLPTEINSDQSWMGYESESSVSASFLGKQTDKAASKYNE